MRLRFWMLAHSIISKPQMIIDTLPSVIRAVGTPSFAEHWLKAINHELKVDHFSLFIFDPALKPKVNCSASLVLPSITTMAGKIYLQYFYLSDPNMDIIRQSDLPSEGPLLLRLKAADIRNPQYRKLIYDEYELCERLSWVGRVEGIWYIANLYRNNSTGGFTQEDIRKITKLSELFLSLIELHLSIVSPQAIQPGSKPSLDWMEQTVGELGSSLTPREIQVCARALLGLTRSGIALDLGVKPPTINTLTQRAYAKLNISNLNELFALCLQAVSLRHGINEPESGP